MFFMPKIVFERNAQNIYTIVAQWKKWPLLRIYPFLYENKKEPLEFKEKRFIMRWRPQLNT